MKVLNRLCFLVRQKLMSNALSRTALTMLAATFASSAFAEYDIGGPSSGPFAQLVDFMQEIVNLLDGPGVLVVTFLSLVAVVGLWMLAPKAQGVMGWALRVAIGAIVILNLGTWILYFKG